MKNMETCRVARDFLKTNEIDRFAIEKYNVVKSYATRSTAAISQ
ncbi:MAG: hypothetical protein ACM3TR_18535 [Caulobacteraceae bacterium]